jgi:hypothetical protein
VELSARGTVTLDSSAEQPQGPPNVFFDGLNPVVQVLHSGHSLQMMLDTGKTPTILHRSIRDVLAQWERDQLTNTQVASVSGAGGSAQFQATLVPSIQFDVRGRTIYLQRISLLSETPAGNAGYWDGILGIDALAGGFRLDFRAMQFTLK